MKYVSSHKELIFQQDTAPPCAHASVSHLAYSPSFDEETPTLAPQFLAEVNSSRHKTFGKTDEGVESLLN